MADCCPHLHLLATKKYSRQINIKILDSSRPLAKTHVYSNISPFLYPLRHASAARFLCLCFLSPSFCFSFFKLIVNRDAVGWELSKQQDNNNCLLSPGIHTFITANTHWSIWLLLTVSKHLTNLWYISVCVCVCVCSLHICLQIKKCDTLLNIHSHTHTHTLRFIYGNEWTHTLQERETDLHALTTCKLQHSA